MRLNLNDALHKLDTAYFDGERKRVPLPQNILLDGRHRLPSLAIFRMIYTVIHTLVPVK